ncbi:MAG: hypothetical protein AAFV33_02550 [Chloroflexota bacterium]
MIQLSNTSVDDLQDFTRESYSQILNETTSFEDAAQRWTRLLFASFQEQDGSPTFALVRIFRISKYEDLLPELQQLADGDSTYWMTLMGTYGIESAWQDRHQSMGHKVFPALSSATPMLKAAFAEIEHLQGFDGKDEIQLSMGQGSTGESFFFVDDAKGSPHIPAQDQFVQPYGIRNVIGFGSQFLNKRGALILSFSRGNISRE